MRTPKTLLFFLCAVLGCVLVGSTPGFAAGVEKTGLKFGKGAAEQVDAAQKKSVAFFYNRADYAIKRKMYDEALDEIRQGTELDPGFLPFLLQKATVYTGLMRHGEAEQSITLALGSMPENVELHVLAIENILSLTKGDAARQSARLTAHFKKVPPAVLPALVAALTEERADYGSDFIQVYKSLLASQVLDAQAQGILAACLAGQGEAAQAQLAGARGSINKAHAPLFAALHVLAAEALQKKKKLAAAEGMYAKGIELGYSQEKALSSKAKIFLQIHEPDKAAQTYEGFWRSSSEPPQWAIQAAKAYAAARHDAKGLAIIRKAVEVAPQDPYLLGQLYYFLTVTGREAERARLADRLKSGKQLLALEYGKYLVALFKGEQTASYAATEAILKQVESITFVHEQPSVHLIMDELKLTGKVSPLDRQSGLLRTSGWQLWEEGRYREAYVYWRDAAMLGEVAGKAGGANISLALLQQNMIPEALEIFKLHFPDLPPFALALHLAQSGQWYAAQPLLAAIKVQEPHLQPWYSLLLANADVKNSPREVALLSARTLLALPPPAGRHEMTVPDRERGLAGVRLDSAYYLTLVRELLTELFRQGYTELFDDILKSRQLALIPPAESAAMLAHAGFDLATAGTVEAAVPLWKAAYRLHPSLAEAQLGMALAEKMLGNHAAAEKFLQAGMASTTDKKDYILGRIKLLDGKKEEAAEHFDAYMRRDQKNLRAAFELFQLYMTMPDYGRARGIREQFKKFPQDTEALMYLGQSHLALGDREQAEKIFRALLKQRPGHEPTVLALVSALKARERFVDAAALLAAHNLEDPEVMTVLRTKAEDALDEQRFSESRDYASQYLGRSPDSVYLNSIFNSAWREEYRAAATELQWLKRDRVKLDKGLLDPLLIDAERLARVKSLDPATMQDLKPDDRPLAMAEEHARALLARNALQRNALESVLDIALQRENFKDAAHISQNMAVAYPYDLHYQLQSAVHMGSISRFDYAFPLVEKMASHGVNASGMALLFPNVWERPGKRSTTAQDVQETLDALQGQYHTVGLQTFLAGPKADASKAKAEKIPLLLVVGQVAPAELKQLDAMLRQREAKAVLLVSEQSFTPGTPAHLPDAALLRALTASGRWDLVLTDTMERTMVKDASGRRVNFWGERGMVDGKPESVEAMRTRWSRAMAAIKQQAQKQGFAIEAWMYPGGDYGQIGLDGDADIRQAYTEAVKQHFATALVPTANGYHTATRDALYLPVRNVYSPLDAEALAALPQAHPNRLAVLEEGLLASWHGQLPRAERRFAQAGALGLSPKDVSYYRANNAIYDTDVPYANELARQARAMDPESLRSEMLVERAERMKNPRLSFTPRLWNDDAGRSYAEYLLNFTTHVREDLALSAFVSDVGWFSSEGNVRGQAAGAALRYYPFKQHWLDVMVRGVTRNDGGGGFAEWRAAWRGVYATDVLNINGSYNLTYSRESLETAESIKKGIYADRLSLNTEARFLNWGVLEAEAFGISRTDGNTTKGATISPRYILWDKPHIRVGYLFGVADSDRNPPEYYAPQEYVNHMAVITGEYELFKSFSVRGMLGYGTARSKDRDWQQVFRYNLGFDWRVVEDLILRGGYQRLELPTYTMDQYTLGIEYVF